jgi:hypothetical protein
MTEVEVGRIERDEQAGLSDLEAATVAPAT